MKVQTYRVARNEWNVFLQKSQDGEYLREWPHAVGEDTDIPCSVAERTSIGLISSVVMYTQRGVAHTLDANETCQTIAAHIKSRQLWVLSVSHLAVEGTNVYFCLLLFLLLSIVAGVFVVVSAAQSLTPSM